MFVAVNNRNQRISLLDHHELSTLKQSKAVEKYYCEVCGQEVLLKLGKQVSWHFAHKSIALCPLGHESETLTHQLGKKKLFEWFKDNGAHISLEYYLPKIQQRPDLFLHAPLFQAIEYQCSTIPLDQLLLRTQGYSNLNINVVWILGGERLQKSSSYTYKLSAMDYMTRRYLTKDDILPLIVYYNPTTDHFTLLHLLFTLTSTQFIAQSQTLPSTLISPKVLFENRQKPIEDYKWQSIWLKQKRKWREKPLLKFSSDERYLYSICKNKGLLFSCFPSIIGIPTFSSVHLTTPTYIWQMWLILKYVFNKRATIHLNPINETFCTMIKRNIFKLRPVLGQSPPTKLIIKEYFDALCTLGILSYCGENSYHILELPKWGNLSLDELLEADFSVLIKLNGQNVR